MKKVDCQIHIVRLLHETSKINVRINKETDWEVISSLHAQRLFLESQISDYRDLLENLKSN